MNHLPRAAWPIWAVLVASAGLVGCASKVDLAQPAGSASGGVGAAVAVAGTSAGGATPAPAAQSRIASVDLTPPGQTAGSAAAGALARYVYFEFDSALLRPEFKPVVDAHARRLSTAADGRLVVEGHTDERGGREYNLALGQRRAESVVRSLVLLGAQPQQVEAISFGEERAKAQGVDESAWALNRRAALVQP